MMACTCGNPTCDVCMRAALVEAEARIEAMHINANTASAVLVGALAKLERWQPVIELVKAWHECTTRHRWCACHLKTLTKLATAIDTLIKQEGTPS